LKILVLILLFLTTVVMAGWSEQEFNESQFHSGVKLGITMSNSLGDDAGGYEHDYKFGFEVGGLILYRINNLMTLQPEFLFTQKGQVLIISRNPDIHVTVNYLQIPVLLSFKTAPGLKLYAGGYVSYLTNVWVSSSNLSDEDESNSEDEIEDATSNFDFGGIVGLMFRGDSNMLFDFRYERGFATLDETNKQDVFNHSFKLSVTWLF